MFVNLFSETGGIGPSQIILIVLLAVMVIVLIVLPMFTNKKRAKAVNELHSSVAPGDIIKTVGGVIGKVIAVRETSPVDREMVVETGEEGKITTMVFDIQAIYQVVKKANAPVTEPFENNDAPIVEEQVSAIEEPIVIAEEPAKHEDVLVVEEKVAIKEETAATVAPKKTVKKTTAKK